MDKQTLRRYADLKAEYEILVMEREELTRMRESYNHPAAPKNDGMPRAEKPYHDSMAEGLCNWIVRCDRLDGKIRKCIEDNIDIMERIEDFINLIHDPCIRNVLRLKYIHRMTWETIAEEMNYSRAQVIRIHDKAFKHDTK